MENGVCCSGWDQGSGEGIQEDIRDEEETSGQVLRIDIKRDPVMPNDEYSQGPVVERMGPGREMDALIAEKVMGENMASFGKCEDGWVIDPLCYSTTISCAWDVVEKMQTDGFKFFMTNEG